MDTIKIIDMLKSAYESDAENIERYVSLSKELGLITKTPDGKLVVNGKALYEMLDTIYNDKDEKHIEIYVNLLAPGINDFSTLQNEWASSKESIKSMLHDMELSFNKEVISSMANSSQLLGINVAHNYPYEELWIEIEKQFNI